jgi:hypothetical protein
MTCPYCGSKNVKEQIGGCTQEECFYKCFDCQMLSDYAVDYGMLGSKPYLKKKNCQSNRTRLKERNENNRRTFS